MPPKMHSKLVILTVAIWYGLFSFIPVYKKCRMAERYNEEFNLMV